MQTISPVYTALVARAWLINDRPPQVKNGQQILERYMADAKALFMTEFEHAISFQTQLTFGDEKRLMGMLQLILDAKMTWQEEEGSIKKYYKE